MSDERALDALRRALDAEVEPVPQPPADQLDTFRRAVAERAAAAPPAPTPRTVPRRNGWRAAAAVAAAAAVFVAGIASTDNLPRPIRQAAANLGLPVEDPDVTDVREAVDDLGLALATGTAADQAGTLNEELYSRIATADAGMLAEIGDLDERERAKLVPVAHQVHLQAVRFFLDRGRALPTAKPADVDELHPR